MPADMMPTNVEYLRVLPEILLTILGAAIMFLEAILKDQQKRIFAPLTIVGLAAAMWASYAAYGSQGLAFHNMMVIDGFATFFRILIMGVGMLAVFSSSEYLARERQPGGEFYEIGRASCRERV